MLFTLLPQAVQIEPPGKKLIKSIDMSGDSMESCCTSNSKLAGRAQKSGRSFAIHCRGAQNLHILRLQLHIIDLSDGQTRCIRFPFDLHGDTPMEVADELKNSAPQLNLSHQEVATITSMITKEIFKALQCGRGVNGGGAPHRPSVSPEKQVAPHGKPQQQQQEHTRCQAELTKPQVLQEQVAHAGASRRKNHHHDHDSTVSVTGSTCDSAAAEPIRGQHSGKKVGMGMGSSTTYTQEDIDLAFSNLSLDDFPSPEELATLKHLQEEELQILQHKHDQEYMDLLNGRLQTRRRRHTHAAHNARILQRVH